MDINKTNIKKFIRNAVLALLFVLLNAFFQIYCRPVLWAEMVAVVCLLWFVAKPLVQEKTPSEIRGFLSSWSCFFWSYCFFFLFTETKKMDKWMDFLPWGVFMFFLLSIKFCKELGVWSREGLSFWVTNIITVLVLVGAANTYHRIAQEMKAGNMKNSENRVFAYWQERIVGMHFIYHTRYCPYDGWRPPKLDPMLTIVLAVNNYEDPLHELSLEQRLQMYRRLYPDRPYKFKCACAKSYAKDYHQAALWETKFHTGNNNQAIYRDTTISLSYKDFEIRLKTYLYDDSLAEKRFYHQDIPYGYTQPYVIKQVLYFYQDGQFLSKREIPIPSSYQTIRGGRCIRLQNLPVFDVSVIENDRTFYFMVYGANYCCGEHCPEFIGIYTSTGEAISENLSHPEEVVSGEPLTEFLKKEKIDINNEVRKVSIFDIFNVEEE